MNEKYYVFITPDDVIWGVAMTRKGAIEDGKVNIIKYGIKYPKGKVVPASYELAWKIWDYGYDVNMWEFVDGMAILKGEPETYYSSIKCTRETTIKY